MPTTLRVADCVYYGMDSFGNKRQSWRITHHLKRIEDTLFTRPKPDDEIDQIIHEVVLESVLKEQADRKAKGWPHTRRYRFQYCTQEEATHVSLRGICGAHAPVEECEFIEEVPWSQERIAEVRAEAIRPFWLNHKTDWHWE